MIDMKMAPEPSLRREDGRAPAAANPGDVSRARTDQDGMATCANAPEIVAFRTPARSHEPNGRHFRPVAFGAIQPAVLHGPLQEEAGSGDRRASIVIAFRMLPLPVIETPIDLVTMVMHLRARQGGSFAAKALAIALPPLRGSDLHRTRIVGGTLARNMPTAIHRAATVAQATSTEDYS